MTRGHRAVTHLYVVLLVGLRLPVGREVVRDAVLGGGGRPLVVLVVVAVHLVEDVTELVVSVRPHHTVLVTRLQLQHPVMLSSASSSSTSSHLEQSIRTAYKLVDVPLTLITKFHHHD